MRMRMRFLAGAAILGSSLGLASPGEAAQITWRFEGVVREVATSQGTADALSSLGVEAGSTFAGQLVFETETPDITPADPSFGSYSGAISVLEVTIGSYQATVPASATRDFVVNATFGAYLLTGYATGSGSVFESPTLRLELYKQPLLSGFETDALPTAPPDLADLTPYDFPTYNTLFFIEGAEGRIFGELTELVQVPEPVGLALLGLAALALLRLPRRVWRSLSAAIPLVVLGSANTAWATPVTFEFEGVIRGIYDATDPAVPVRADIAADLTSLGVVVGAPGRGDFGYDDEAPYWGGEYDPTSVSFALQIGTLSASLREDGTWGVLSAYWCCSARRSRTGPMARCLRRHPRSARFTRSISPRSRTTRSSPWRRRSASASRAA